MQDSTATTPLRFALVGCGRVAPTHFEAIQALGDKGRLIAVCDANPTALQNTVERTGAEGYSDLASMLAREDIDVVSICTPSGLHAQHGISVAKAGKHVLVEKPIDVTLEAAQALVDTCNANGVHLFPVFQNRLNSTIQLVKEAIDKGRFGKIYALNSTVIWKRTQDYYDADAWRGTRAMDGGAFMNQGIHFVDAMCYLCGDVSEVKSMLGTLARDMECEDTGSALLRFENGALGNIFVTMLGQTDQEGSLTVIGEKGTVKIGGTALNTIEQWNFQHEDAEMDAKAKDADYITKSVYGFGHSLYYHQVADHLQHDTQRPTEAQDSLRTLKAILDIYASESMRSPT
jgi:UDP-N-acetyl-2-amino-2-deoxyglucuronate dehydrogenase